MARVRQILTVSIAAETKDRLAEISEILAARLGLKVHPGIVMDALVREATPETVLDLLQQRQPEPTHG